MLRIIPIFGRQAAVLVTLLLLLGACGDDSDPPGVARDTDDLPVEILRIGAPGQATDQLNPLTTNGIADYTAVFHIYDTLVRLTDDGVELALAESIEPNSDATEWTITVRDGATFHDGAPVTADDVVASFALMADPEQSPNYAQFFADVDLDASRAEDERTAVIALRRPRGDFADTVLTFASFVFREGHTDWQDPVGSGPYRLESYEPGGTTVLAAHEEHWEGPPTVGRLEITTVADATARLNAVRSGELDVALRIEPAGAASVDGDEVEVMRGGTAFANAMTLVLNTDAPPFDSLEVRRAISQAIDRQALVDTVLLGYGTVGHDLVGAGLPGLVEDLDEVERDVDAARATLTANGVTDMTIVVGDVTPGIVSAGEVIAEQLAEVGVDVRLDRRDPTTYYTDSEEFLARPAQSLYWVNRPAPAFLGNFTGSAAFFNPSGFATPEYDALLTDAQSETDDERRRELFDEAQRLFQAESGNVVWGYQELLDAAATGVSGIRVVQSIPLFSKATRS